MQAQVLFGLIIVFMVCLQTQSAFQNTDPTIESINLLTHGIPPRAQCRDTLRLVLDRGGL